MKLTRTLGGISAAALALTMAACGSDPTDTSSGSDGDSSKPIVVGSAAFGESEILAEIYAGALKAKGVDATTKLDIGAREVYVKALQAGEIDLVPEYTGNLLTYLDPKRPPPRPPTSRRRSTKPP